MRKKVRIYNNLGEFLEIRDFPRVPTAAEYVEIEGMVLAVWRVYFPSVGIPRIQLASSISHNIVNQRKDFFE